MTSIWLPVCIELDRSEYVVALQSVITDDVNQLLGLSNRCLQESIPSPQRPAARSARRGCGSGTARSPGADGTVHDRDSPQSTRVAQRNYELLRRGRRNDIEAAHLTR